jgi:hypothetical protein
MRKLWVKAWMTLDGVFDADTMDHWWHPYDWNWPRKMYPLNLEINSSLIEQLVQKQADSYTQGSNVNGQGYKSILRTRRWQSVPLAASSSAFDWYTP